MQYPQTAAEEAEQLARAIIESLKHAHSSQVPPNLPQSPYTRPVLQQSAPSTTSAKPSDPDAGRVYEDTRSIHQWSSWGGGPEDFGNGRRGIYCVQDDPNGVAADGKAGGSNGAGLPRGQLAAVKQKTAKKTAE